MMRRSYQARALATGVAMLLVPSAASALEFSVLGPTTVTVEAGEAFTLDIALDNLLEESVQGITGLLSGLSSAGAIVTGGQIALAHVSAVCLPPPSGCLGGVSLRGQSWIDPDDLSRGLYSPGDDSLLIVDHLALAPSTWDGSADPGLDGDLTEPSPRDVTIDLIAQTVGVHVLTIGGSFSNGTSTLPIVNNATLTLRVIPEPGVALLLGLGLMGLCIDRATWRRARAR